MSATVLDASALMSFMLNQPAAETVEGLLRGPTTVASVNALEVVDRLIRGHGKDPDDVEADLTLLATSGMEIVSIDAGLAVAAGRLRARHYDRVDNPVSLADCLVAALAIQRGLTLATSDRGLVNLVRSEGGTVHPLPDSTGATP